VGTEKSFFPCLSSGCRQRRDGFFRRGASTFTDREKEVLEMLVAGRSNKEKLALSWELKSARVKAHVAKLMRKVGVQNRIALSVHAITHSLVAAK